MHFALLRVCSWYGITQLQELYRVGIWSSFCSHSVGCPLVNLDKFKVLTIMYKTLHGLGPLYMGDCLLPWGKNLIHLIRAFCKCQLSNGQNPQLLICVISLLRPSPYGRACLVRSRRLPLSLHSINYAKLNCSRRLCTDNRTALHKMV